MQAPGNFGDSVAGGSQARDFDLTATHRRYFDRSVGAVGEMIVWREMFSRMRQQLRLVRNAFGRGGIGDGAVARCLASNDPLAASELWVIQPALP